MHPIARVWLGSAALAAGLLHVALALGASTLAAIALIAAGAAEFLWGVFCFPAPRLPLPRVAAVGAAVPIVGWLIALVAGHGLVTGVRVFPMLVASLLDLVVALGIAILLRRARSGREAPPEHPTRTLVAMLAGMLAVAAIALPALAATEAGASIRDGVPLPLPAHLGH